MELIQHYLLPCLWAFLACSGFCALYNIHGLGIVLCSLGGSLGWLVYLVAEALGTGATLAAFLAGLVIAAYAETMARIRKCPASGYLPAGAGSGRLLYGAGLLCWRDRAFSCRGAGDPGNRGRIGHRRAAGVLRGADAEQFFAEKEVAPCLAMILSCWTPI